jgi:hypothetical protein
MVNEHLQWRWHQRQAGECLIGAVVFGVLDMNVADVHPARAADEMSAQAEPLERLIGLCKRAGVSVMEVARRGARHSARPIRTSREIKSEAPLPAKDAARAKMPEFVTFQVGAS